MRIRLSAAHRMGSYVALAVWGACSLPASAETLEHYVAPHIGGHVTDPSGKLAGAEKDEIESLFGGIQGDTKVDVAAFIAPVSRSEIEAAGRRAFEQWGIGRAWESGVLLTISSDGQGCRLIVPSVGSPLAPSAISDIETAASQPARGGHFAEALRLAGDRMGKLLRARAKIPIVRPVGSRDLARSAEYGVGAFLVAVAAAIFSVRRRPAWRAP